jgi:hypothetical protein
LRGKERGEFTMIVLSRGWEHRHRGDVA